MAKFKNTLQRGSVRCIVFKEDDTYYATALEFNITESGDTPREALLLLFEAVTGYVEAARKIKARPSILNQKPDSEYEEMWKRRSEEKFSKSKNIFFSGELNIGQVMAGSCVPAF
jgi:hypothetical protein